MLDRYGINNFVYSARRPFHPRRLFALLHDKFILLQNKEVDEEEEEEEDDEDGQMETDQDGDADIEDVEDEDEEEDSDTEIEDFEQPDPQNILANKRNHPAFGPVLRSKGFIWLATRPIQMGEWSQAGGMLTMGSGGPWFAEVPREAWPEDDDIIKSIDNDFSGPWGDRRQEIVFIGENINTEAITDLLNECLLNDEEWAQWEKVMSRKRLSIYKKADKLSKMWEDGWEPWPVLELEEEGAACELPQQDAPRPKHRIGHDHTGHNHAGHNHSHGKPAKKVKA